MRLGIALLLVAISGPAFADADLDALVRAYPDFLKSYDAKDLILRNGQRIPIDDDKGGKTVEQRLDDADIDDMFAVPYPIGRDFPVPETFADDPGRVRNAALFDAMYGDCRKAPVKMRAVKWLPKSGGGSVRVATANGLADKLEAVSNELDALPARYKVYLKPTAGTFNCRPIAGTRRMSMHGYGAAIDINVKYSDYWRFGGARRETDKVTWKNRIPFEIVEIFERHGFIWGGKWYHYDTMHFEYRPEILARGRVIPGRSTGNPAVAPIAK